jgi:hypothetical protein
MEEKFLYHIWDERHLANELKTVSGKNLRIVYQGQFNTGRGPDFKNAIIEIQGEQLRGDIEIHLKTQDWQAHNHQEDIYYNQVILHVVLEHKTGYSHTIREDGALIEILELSTQLSEDISKLMTAHESPQRPSVYCDLLSAISNDNLRLILHSAGLRRFKAKIARFNSALSLSSFDQLFYEGLFEALGYDKNKLNTLQLAQGLPLAQLREYKAQGMSKEELAAIYLCSSDLLKAKPAIIDEALYQKLWRLYEAQAWQGRKLHIDWQLFRIRPQNHPLKRILHLTDLIWECLEGGLLQHFLTHTSAFNNDPKAHSKAYSALWPQSEIFDGYPTKIGKSVQDNIYLNILLPVTSLWTQKLSGDPQEIYNLYAAFPGLQQNYITRFMSRYMSPEQSKIADSKAIYQQGLLDIYHRFCSWHFCQECTESFKPNN